MENVMTNGFYELNEQEMMETTGGDFIIVGAIIITAALATALIGPPAVSVANHNKRVLAQAEADKTKQPVVAPQWFAEDVTMYPQPDLLEQALGY